MILNIWERQNDLLRIYKTQIGSGYTKEQKEMNKLREQALAALKARDNPGQDTFLWVSEHQHAIIKCLELVAMEESPRTNMQKIKDSNATIYRPRKQRTVTNENL